MYEYLDYVFICIDEICDDGYHSESFPLFRFSYRRMVGNSGLEFCLEPSSICSVFTQKRSLSKLSMNCISECLVAVRLQACGFECSRDQKF